MSVAIISKIEIVEAMNAQALTEFIMQIDFGQLDRVSELLAELHNTGTFDLIRHLEQLYWNEMPQRERSRWLHILQKSIPKVQSEPTQIIQFFHETLDCVPRGNIYGLQKGYEDWVVENTSCLPEIANALRLGQRDTELLGATLYAWRQFDIDAALQAAIDFSLDSKPKMRSQAIGALGFFNYESPQNLDAAEQRLLELSRSDNNDDRVAALGSIIRILENLADKPVTLLSAIEAATDSPSTEVRHQLIWGFARHRKAYPENLRNIVLNLMVSVSVEHEGTLDVVDSALYAMDFDQEYEDIFNVLTALASQDQGAPKLKALDSTSHKLLSSSPAKLGWFVVGWLLESHHAVCRQLDSFFPPLDESLYNFSLAEFALSDADVSYLTRKIFGYLVFSHGPAVSLLSACLAAVKLEQRKSIESGIAAFWLRNFPNDLELFDAHCKTFPKKGMKASIDRMRKIVEDYQAPLRALPRNPAMRPSSLERRVQAELRHQQQKDIHKKAEENSILGSLFHKSVLLYGRSSVFYMSDGGDKDPVRQEMQMQHFETSSALPRMDALYPTRLNYLMHRFRNESRPK